jgi:O-antigen/teichoic acid export membrane protein
MAIRPILVLNDTMRKVTTLADRGAAGHVPEKVAHRYAATLVAQLAQMVFATGTAAIVPRALGPASYGNYYFLLNTAAAIRGLEPSTQQAFFTFSAQDEKSGPLTRLYGLTLVVQVGLVCGVIALSAWTGVMHWIWPGQRLVDVAWVTLLDWILFLALTLRQIGDSKGLTVRPQMLTLAASAFNFAALVCLLLAGVLTFATFVFINLLSGAAACGLLAYWLLSRHADLWWNSRLRGRVKSYAKRWWTFSGPLIGAEYYGRLTAYLGTYLVQFWYGSVAQGQLAVALRWSGLVLVFTSSALSIFWREIAAAASSGDHQAAGRIFLRFNRALFSLVIALCVWLSFTSRTLVRVVAGHAYEGAIPVLAVMAFYPLQQTYGQINTAALKASERTRTFRNIVVALSVPELLVTYWLLAPRTAAVPGLELGGLGVAIQMVCFGLVSVQVYEMANFRFWGLNYLQALGQKLQVALLVGACGLLLLLGPEQVIGARHVPGLPALVLTSASYFVMVATLGWTWPRLFVAAERDDLKRLGRSAIRRFRLVLGGE